MGLAPLDAGDPLFGRDAELATCLARSGDTGLLVVTGPSGSGKSSPVRAGLVPALERQGRRFVVVPDATGTLDLPDGRTPAPVLVIDQFEQVLVADMPPSVVRAMCAALAAYASSRALVGMTVRSDHLAGLAVDPTLGRLAENNMLLLGPLTGDALLEAIQRPAAEAGLRLEPGLIELVAMDVEAGALPLMSHALAETWRRREGNVLTVAAYRASGGIRGAVARSADRLYESLPPDQRVVLRSVLLRLVMPSLDGEPLRCRIPSRALGTGPARDQVLGRLMAARLVTAEDGALEISHEALVRAWPRLQAWLDEDAAGLRVLCHLAVAADGWESLGRPDSELYRGARLEAAQEYRESGSGDLTAGERDFLDASLRQSESEKAALRAQARTDALRNRRLRALLATSVALLLFAVGTGIVADRRADDARRAADQATIEAVVNQSLVRFAGPRWLAGHGGGQGQRGRHRPRRSRRQPAEQASRSGGAFGRSLPSGCGRRGLRARRHAVGNLPGWRCPRDPPTRWRSPAVGAGAGGACRAACRARHRRCARRRRTAGPGRVRHPLRRAPLDRGPARGQSRPLPVVHRSRNHRAALLRHPLRRGRGAGSPHRTAHRSDTRHPTRLLGDLVVRGDGSELVAFGAESPAITRWRLDGSGPVSPRIADGYVAADRFGYDDNSLFVARRPPGATRDTDLTDFALWDTDQNRMLDDIGSDLREGIEGMAWAGRGLLVGMDASASQMRWYDVATRALVDGPRIGFECDHLWASANGERAYCGGTEGQVWTIDVAARRLVEPTLKVDGWVRSVSATRGGKPLVVTSATDRGPQTVVLGAASGEVLAGPIVGPDITSVSEDGTLFGATAGAITRHDLETLQPLGELAGARGDALGGHGHG